MSDITPVDLNDIATKIRHGVYSSYRAVTIGGAPQVTAQQFDRMRTPRIGDLVIEETTIYTAATQPDIDAVGILEEFAEEPVDFGDEKFVWDEAIVGRPHPLEPVFYVRTLDGRRVRWTNARFIAAGADI